MTLARSTRATTARKPRRAPADLPFDFADRGLAEALATERDEPAWLRDERLAAFAAFESLPVESNQLYTPYIDLRAADLFAVRPFIRTASASASSPDALSAVPAGTSGLIELDEVARETRIFVASSRRCRIAAGDCEQNFALATSALPEREGACQKSVPGCVGSAVGGTLVKQGLEVSGRLSHHNLRLSASTSRRSPRRDSASPRAYSRRRDDANCFSLPPESVRTRLTRPHWRAGQS